MRKICLLLIAVILLTCVCSCNKNGGLDPEIGTIEKTEDGVYYYAENKIKMLTLNLCDANKYATESREERLPKITKLLNEKSPDVMGLQEVNEFWKENLINAKLSDKYTTFTIYAYDNVKGSSILFRKDKFDLLDSGRFWYADNPDEKSKWPDAENYSIVVWVKLKEKKTGQEMFFFNTQTDPKEDARDRIDYVLVSKIKQMCKNTPYFLVGDFAISDDNPSYAAIKKIAKDVGLEKKATKGTNHNFGKYETPRRDDYIFANPGVITYSCKVLDEKIDDAYYSDHYAVMAELIIVTPKEK